MITVNVRKQGGAAIVTIPSDVMKLLHIRVGTALQLDVREGMLTARAVASPSRKRYSLKELLRGVTPATLSKLNKQTRWARQGKRVGRELT